MKKPKIGETYYFVPYDSRENHQELVVTSIGTKYFYTTHWHKFDKKSYIEDCGKYSSSGRIFNDEKDYNLSLRAASCKMEIPSLLVGFSVQDVVDVYEYIKNKISNYEKD